MAACWVGAVLLCYSQKVQDGWSSHYTAGCYCKLIRCHQVAKTRWMHKKQGQKITFPLKLPIHFSSQDTLSERIQTKRPCHKPVKISVGNIFLQWSSSALLDKITIFYKEWAHDSTVWQKSDTSEKSRRIHIWSERWSAAEQGIVKKGIL